MEQETTLSDIQDILKDAQDFRESPEGYGFRLRFDLARIIAQSLKEHGWTQRDLSDLCDDISESKISRIIHSDVNCTFRTAGRILHALRVKAALVPQAQAESVAVTTDWTAQFDPLDLPANYAQQTTHTIEFEDTMHGQKVPVRIRIPQTYPNVVGKHWIAHGNIESGSLESADTGVYESQAA